MASTHSVLLLILDIFISIIVFPTLLLFLGPVLLYRIIVILFVKIIYPYYIPARLLDSQVVYDYFQDSKYPLIFSPGAVITLNGSLPISRFKEYWRKNFIEARDEAGSLIYPVLSTTVVNIGGHVFFKPLESVDLDECIREVSLKPSKLDAFKSDFVSCAYKKGTPLWEFAVAHFNNETRVFCRFHHAIADGYTQILLLNQLLTKPSLKKTLVKKEPEPGYQEKFMAALRFPRLLTLYFLDAFRVRKANPLTAGKSDRIFTSSTQIYLSELKQIYRKTGASFLAINLALYTQVILRIFKGRKHGSRMYIQTALPYPNHPAQQGKMGNQFIGTTLPVPLTEMTRLERVREIDTGIKKFCAQSLDKTCYWFIVPLVCIFPARIVGVITESMRKILGLRCVFSNLMNFDDFEYELEEFPVVSIKTLLTRCSYGAALLGSLITYSERCEVTFIGTPDVAKDQEEMDRIVNEYFLEEMAAMLEETETKNENV